MAPPARSATLSASPPPHWPSRHAMYGPAIRTWQGSPSAILRPSRSRPPHGGSPFTPISTVSPSTAVVTEPPVHPSGLVNGAPVTESIGVTCDAWAPESPSPRVEAPGVQERVRDPGG